MIFKKGENSSANPNRAKGETDKTEYEKEQEKEIKQIRTSDWGTKEARGDNAQGDN